MSGVLYPCDKGPRQTPRAISPAGGHKKFNAAELRDIVGGHFVLVRLQSPNIAVCCEEASLMGLAYNILVEEAFGVALRGTVLVVDECAIE